MTSTIVALSGLRRGLRAGTGQCSTYCVSASWWLHETPDA
jgi:hypothetical protein